MAVGDRAGIVLAMTLGSAVVHLVHQGPKAVGIAVGLRLGLPLAAATPGLIMVGFGIDRVSSGDGDGLVAAGVFTATVLGAAGYIFGVYLDVQSYAYAEAPDAEAAWRLGVMRRF